MTVTDGRADSEEIGAAATGSVAGADVPEVLDSAEMMMPTIRLRVGRVRAEGWGVGGTRLDSFRFKFLFLVLVKATHSHLDYHVPHIIGKHHTHTRTLTHTGVTHVANLSKNN